MKKIVYLLISLSVFGLIVAGQTTEIPSSKVIDAKQLLRDVEILAADDMEGRKVGTPGGVKAREHVLKRFKDIGLEAVGGEHLQPLIFTDRGKKEWKGANVFGVLKGRKNPEKFIVVTAHYDHLGIRNGEIFNSADDDASGTSALFALGTYFKKHLPSSSLIFVAFDAEETGGAGSRKFVAESPVKQASIVMNVNLDMIGHNDKNELYAVGTYHYPFLKPYLEGLVKSAKVKLLFGHDAPELKDDDWTFQSDHGSFHRQKIPFIYFGVEDHKDYHKSTDDYPTLTKPFYVHAVETIVEAIKVFDKNSASIEAKR
jgi:Zn-dependent M28 family amino/carboxypeptidase